MKTPPLKSEAFPLSHEATGGGAPFANITDCSDAMTAAMLYVSKSCTNAVRPVTCNPWQVLARSVWTVVSVSCTLSKGNT
jgi:hypothetical protein